MPSLVLKVGITSTYRGVCMGYCVELQRALMQAFQFALLLLRRRKSGLIGREWSFCRAAGLRVAERVKRAGRVFEVGF